MLCHIRHECQMNIQFFISLMFVLNTNYFLLISCVHFQWYIYYNRLWINANFNWKAFCAQNSVRYLIFGYERAMTFRWLPMCFSEQRLVFCLSLKSICFSRKNIIKCIQCITHSKGKRIQAILSSDWLSEQFPRLSDNQFSIRLQICVCIKRFNWLKCLWNAYQKCKSNLISVQNKMYFYCAVVLTPS